MACLWRWWSWICLSVFPSVIYKHVSVIHSEDCLSTAQILQGAECPKTCFKESPRYLLIYLALSRAIFLYIILVFLHTYPVSTSNSTNTEFSQLPDPALVVFDRSEKSCIWIIFLLLFILTLFFLPLPSSPMHMQHFLFLWSCPLNTKWASEVFWRVRHRIQAAQRLNACRAHMRASASLCLSWGRQYLYSPHLYFPLAKKAEHSCLWLSTAWSSPCHWKRLAINLFLFSINGNFPLLPGPSHTCQCSQLPVFREQMFLPCKNLPGTSSRTGLYKLILFPCKEFWS